MAEPTSTKRQLVTAFIAVAVLVMLLVVGGVWSWRSASNTSADAQSKAAGPVAKLSTWIEPPPAPPFTLYERTLLLYERNFTTTIRVGAVYQYRQLTTGADQQFAQFAEPTASAALPSTGNAAP